MKQSVTPNRLKRIFYADHRAANTDFVKHSTAGIFLIDVKFQMAITCGQLNGVQPVGNSGISLPGQIAITGSRIEVKRYIPFPGKVDISTYTDNPVPVITRI